MRREVRSRKKTPSRKSLDKVEADADGRDWCILCIEKSCWCLLALLQRHAEILLKWGVQVSADELMDRVRRKYEPFYPCL